MSNTVQTGIFLGLLAVVAGVVAVGFAYEDVAGLMIVGFVVIILGGIIVPRLLPQTDRSFLLKLAILGFIAKIGGSLARLGITEAVWGFQDADRYHSTGTDFAEAVRSLDFNAAFATVESTTTIGTQTTEIFTGIVYSGLGASIYGGFLVFAFMAFIGSLFFIKAFDQAFDGRNIRIFAVLMFFYPSLLLWPSSLGKDAILFFFAGLAAYGVVKSVFRLQLIGLAPAAIGMMGMLLVRPHVGAIGFAALGVAMVVRNPGRAISNHIKYSIIVVIIGTLIFVGYSQVGRVLGVESVSVEGLLQVLTTQAENEYTSGEGGSNFSVTSVTDPMWLPLGLVTVLFRPFPWEANSALVVIQSFEPFLLALLVAFKSKSILNNLLMAPKNPFLVYVIVFLILNVVPLSTLGNFGLLSRQRALVFPFVFVLVSAQLAVDRRADQGRLNRSQIAGA